MMYQYEHMLEEMETTLRKAKTRYLGVSEMHNMHFVDIWIRLVPSSVCSFGSVMSRSSPSSLRIRPP